MVPPLLPFGNSKSAHVDLIAFFLNSTLTLLSVQLLKKLVHLVVAFPGEKSKQTLKAQQCRLAPPVCYRCRTLSHTSEMLSLVTSPCFTKTRHQDAALVCDGKL